MPTICGSGCKSTKPHVLRFAKHPDVAFDQQSMPSDDLRMAKVKQKVSGCFRTRKYARSLLPHLKLSAVHGESGLQPARWPFSIALAGRAVDNMGE